MLGSGFRESDLPRTAEAEEKFLAVLPRIEAYAEFRFRARPHCYREELVAEVVAYAWRWFSRLIQRGKDPTQFLATFSRYAILAVKNGRSIGRSYNGKELWTAAARNPELRVQSLENRRGTGETAWKDMLTEKRAFPPAEVAATRLDFATWRQRLPARSRRVADLLARGEQASAVARELQISRARVTQLRQELAASWRAFQGEVEPAGGSIDELQTIPCQSAARKDHSRDRYAGAGAL